MSALTEAVTSGSLLLAIPVAALAGVVAFASPCVLPLVPGYVSFTTGLIGADLAEARGTRDGRRLIDHRPALYVRGFTQVFETYAVLIRGVGQLLYDHQRVLQVALGLVAPGPRPRPPVSATAAPAAVSDMVARDGTTPPLTLPVTSPR